MTAQLSRERIEQYLQSAEGQKISSFDSGKLIAVEPDYVIALCRMALAVMESEPVAYMIGGHYLMHAADPKVDNYASAVPLYTAPPAPVAVPVTRWIKCSERMPSENDRDIWLWNGSGHPQNGYIWNGDRFVDWNEEYMGLYDVTHWMPMSVPASPEQEV